MGRFQRGLLVLECGKSSVRMSPALTVTEAEMTTALRLFGEAVAAVAGDRRRDPRRGHGRRGAQRGRRRRSERGSSVPAQRLPDNRREPASKVATMRDAIADLVRDGDTVAIEGFTHLISFAAGHEIIRQRKRDLTLARLTPDLIYDQMVAAGVARKLDLLAGSATRASAGSARSAGGSRATTRTSRSRSRSTATSGWSGGTRPGAMNLPFFPLRSYFETDLPKANPLIRPIESPYGDGTVYAVPPLRPDVTIVHAQRAVGRPATPRSGACSAARRRRRSRPTGSSSWSRSSSTRRSSGPTRTGRSSRASIVDAVVVEPWGAHPSYVQGAYDRDNRFYLDWDPITPRRGRRPGLAARVGLRRWTVAPAYVEKLGAERLASPAAVRVARRPARSTTGSTVSDDRPLMILVAGPYRSGTDGDPGPDPGQRGRDDADVALELYRRGHLPVMGEWFALPLIEAAERAPAIVPDAGRRRIFHPIAERRARPLRRLPPDRRAVRGRGPDGRRSPRRLGKAVYHRHRARCP